MRRIAALCVLLFVAGTCAAESAIPRDPNSHFFNDTFGNFSEELQNAREQGKKGVFIFFEMDECPFCHYMMHNVLNRPDVQAFYRKNFLNFTVDIEGDVEITDFKGRSMPEKDFAFKINRVRATPVLAFYDLEGHQVHRYTGRTSGPEEFLWMGQYVADKMYKKESFTRYKRARRKE